jgi:poly(3-hydroxybutyrate) depolymerase
MSASRKVALLLVLVLLGLTANDAFARRPRNVVTTTESLTINGQRRTYRIDVPRTVDPAVPTAIVFGYHGKGGSATKFATQTGFNQMAPVGNFILICPDAAPEWPLELTGAAKDLAFFDAILASVKSEFAIDPARVFVTGMSNGASFAHLLASERANVVAAIAPHSGKLGLYARDGINASYKYPVFIIHGTTDTSVPLSRAQEARDLYRIEGHDVTYLEIPGLGHKWATAYDITPKIWGFFATHPRR